MKHQEEVYQYQKTMAGKTASPCKNNFVISFEMSFFTGLKMVKDIWRDHSAMEVALVNLFKITGLKLIVIISLSGFEDES